MRFVTSPNNFHFDTGFRVARVFELPEIAVDANIAFGLRRERRSKSEIKARTDEMLKLVQMERFADRKPHELSGGQQQRVQLARALVLDRDILLLDEPLAALDAQLRKDMCLELKHLQEQFGITFIHVTHNQEEAMTVADRIALVADGELVEHGNARDIYRAPERTFTASFVGENNILKGRITEANGTTARVSVAGSEVVINKRGLDVFDGQDVNLSIRSECVAMARMEDSAPTNGAEIIATYDESVYLGLTTSHIVHLSDGTEVVSRVISDGFDELPAKGEQVRLSWVPETLRLHVN